MSTPSYSVNVVSSTGQIFPAELNDDLISGVKVQIEAQGGPPPSLNDLYFNNQLLDDNQFLSSYSLQPTGETLDIDVGSGVISYDMTNALDPPLGAANLAHLRDGAALAQDVTGIVGGTSYQLAFYARGPVRWTVTFLDAGNTSVGGATNDLVGPDPDLTPFTDVVAAPSAAVSATIMFEALGSAVLFDIVSFRSI